MRERRVLLLFVAASMAATQASGQARMTLADCLETARQNNLALRSGRISIERAADLQATAFDAEMTEVALSQSPTTGGGPENALTVSQSFEFPTVYAARKRLLKAETRLEKARYERDAGAIEREVSSAYCSLAYAMEKKRLLEERDTVYSRFLSIAEARYKSGASGELERMNARRLYEENRVAIADAGQNVANAQLQLALWMGTDTVVLPAEEKFEAIELSADELSSFRPQSVPAVALASEASAVAERRLGLSRQSFMPGISLGLSTQMLIKGFNPYNVDRSRFTRGDIMGFDIGISVPLFWGAKRARLKAAKKEVEQSRLSLEQATREASAGFQVARNEYLQAKSKLDYYRTHGLDDAAETYRIARISYENGEIAYAEYIQNLQAAFSLRMACAEAIDQYNQTAVRLKYIHSNQ